MATPSQFQPVVCHVPVVIQSGQTASVGVADLSGCTLCGMYLPSGFTGTTMTFQACDTSGGTFIDIQDGAGAAVSKTVAAGKYVKLDPADFAGVQFLKLVAGSAQAGQATINLAVRPV